MFTVVLVPVEINSEIASPVAGEFKIPQQPNRLEGE